jgi:hypothetical protein
LVQKIDLKLCIGVDKLEHKEAALEYFIPEITCVLLLPKNLFLLDDFLAVFKIIENKPILDSVVVIFVPVYWILDTFYQLVFFKIIENFLSLQIFFVIDFNLSDTFYRDLIFGEILF